jgi:aminoglycoside phosphotransferase (APT) family kinase protein
MSTAHERHAKGIGPRAPLTARFLQMPKPLEREEGAETPLAHALQRFLQDHGLVSNLRVMEDGHAGLTFGFMLSGRNGDARDLILKKAPDGVPRRGSTDIYRQVPLLRALSSAGFPAPDVPWASETGHALGAPFIIMDRLPGRGIIVWDPSPAGLEQFVDQADVWTEAARLMAALHAFDWRDTLSGWEEKTSLSAELERWTRLLRHTQDEGLLRAAEALSARLRATTPSNSAIGLLHGDLQPGNVLYEQGCAHGLIDWDLASIGPIGMDVGWLLMIGDAEGWSSTWTPHAAPSANRILDAYRMAGGAAPNDLNWHRAFAFFRMAAITGLNVKLHRDGRRRDPIWEYFAGAVPFMLSRATSLMDNAT